MSGGEDKTEKPTPKKLEEARAEGQVTRTQDLSAWVAILVVSMMIGPALKGLISAFADLYRQLPALMADPTLDGAKRAFTEASKALLVNGGPMLLLLGLIGLLSGMAQGGTKPHAKRLKPKTQMLNPIAGAKRLLGAHSWWELAKALIKTTVVAIFAWRDIAALVPVFVNASGMAIGTTLAAVTDGVTGLVRDVAVVGLVLAGFDYLIQRRMMMKKLRMTKKEVSDEHKNAEGNPQSKGAMRARARALSRNRMMAAVPTADVLILNPTHIAVALKYDPGHGTPQVVAIGTDHLAARMREIASDNRIPMIQDKPLARALHASCKVGDDIPPELFTAVAKVLAFIMTLKRRGSAAGVHSADLVASALARR